MTHREASDVEEQIAKLEKRLLAPETRRSVSELEELLAEDFLEFGKSGRSFDRRAIVEALQKESPLVDATVSDFRVRQLGEDAVLATYTVRAGRAEGAATSLRSSVWVRRDERWQLVFHQGTSKADDEE